MLATHSDEWLPDAESGLLVLFRVEGISIMGRKALRSLVVSGVLVAGVGLVGVSAASAMIPPDPGYSSGQSGAEAEGVDGSVFKSVTVDGLRVRTGPGTDHAILGLIYEGQPVQVIASGYGYNGQRWDEVMLQRDSAGGLPGGYVGWVSESYLY
ncbi:SH3 domain-containing protein [Streptomyces sp. NBC_01387]|uniref:SH3 domain-containing protein n=1 Tax=Streptomyces sp. NBC_01387 TaxID=2903849 RepID=UPI003246E11D